jgi:MraZ protein
VFRGSTPLSLDSKGRLAIPTRYREAFQARAAGKLVVTADSPACLLIYAAPDWEPIQKRIMDLPSLNPRVRSLQRMLVGRASDVEMDAAGRILIPATLRKLAGLEKDVMLVGQGGKFELWDVVRWDEQQQQASLPEQDDVPPELEGFSL